VTLAFQAMVMMVLAICGAVAAVPTLLTRPDPKLSPPLRVGLERPGLWIVESPKDLWFVNGLRSSRADLEKLFTRKQSNQMIHYLPSDASWPLPFGALPSPRSWSANQLMRGS